MQIGVLALQGDFAEHRRTLDDCGYMSFEVRNRHDLESADALIIPGGESTAILKLIDRHDLREPLQKRIGGGLPVFGTCAGAIVLAEEVSDGEVPLGMLHCRVVRNAYGRQVDSFEEDVKVTWLDRSVRAVFIRAPVIERIDQDVTVLARRGENPVLLRQANLLASTFHPELVGEQAIHRYFVESCAKQLSSGKG